jgi:reticulon-4-interacting protein 1, mitochondrial
VIDSTQVKKLSAELKRQFGREPFDAIIDCIGAQDVYTHCAGYLKPGGVYSSVSVRLSGSDISCGLMGLPRPTSRWLGGVGRRWVTVQVAGSRLDEMMAVARLLAEKRIWIPIDSVWDYRDAVKAYEVVCSSRARGRVIIKWGEAYVRRDQSQDWFANAVATTDVRSESRF